MNANDIRTANELCQEQCQYTASVGAQESGLLSLQCSMLTEIAAQLAELNDKLKIILNPPEMSNSVLTAMQPKTTLRDQFALASMQSLLARNPDSDRNELAAKAYFFADGMMNARN